MTESEAIKDVKIASNTEEQNIKATIDIQTKIAELEAKVYTYEKIIANSNFAPIIIDLKEKDK